MNLIVLRGEATLCSFMVGERVVYLRAGEQVEVRGTVEQLIGLQRRLSALGGVRLVREVRHFER